LLVSAPLNEEVGVAPPRLRDQFLMLPDQPPGFRNEPSGFGQKALELVVVQRFREE
jgi:hypothetical protein